MIYIAGAGGTAVAARAMRQIQRRIDRRFEQFKEKRRARRRARAKYYLDDEPVRVDFPCTYLCASCGYFVDSSDDDQAPTDTPCPACGQSEWLDLAVKRLADSLRDLDAEDRMRAPTSVRGGVSAVTLALLVLLFIWLGAGISAFLVSTAVAIVAFPVAWLVVTRPVSVLLLRGAQDAPHRWRVPLGLPAPDATADRTFRGRASSASGELVTAPVSGRECLAYQICVLFDAPGDARPPEWALEEQRGVTVRFDNLEVDPAHLFLELPTERVEVPTESNRHADDEEASRYAAVKRLLRQRGLFITDGEFEFYEARLEPGAEVTVAQHNGGIYVVADESREVESGQLSNSASKLLS